MKGRQHTKLIVIVGFIIMMSLCILGITLIYSELQHFSESNDTTAERKELVITNNLFASLYRVESIGNVLFSGKRVESLIKYDSLTMVAEKQIDSLKRITQDVVLIEHLDSITGLLELKRENIRRMLSLLDSIKVQVPKEAVKKTIILRHDEDVIEDILSQSIKKFSDINFEDSTFVKTEKKSFFKRVKNVFVEKADSSLSVSKKREEKRDSLLIPALTDTISQYLQEISLKYEERHHYLTRQLASKQGLMFQVNEELSSQINTILHAVEKREYEMSIALLKEKEITLRRSSKIVSIIAILASITTLLFLIMALISISNSQRYKRELEDAKKYTEDLLEARERLIFSITHDIKAPVSSIIGYMELLSKNKLSEKEKYYIENMRRSSEHILELVRNLLDYHSLETDKYEIQTMLFYPAILLKDVFHSFIPLAQKSGVDFRCNCQLNKGQAYESDPYRIRQICENLLSNAIKFTGSKGEILLSNSYIPVDEDVDLLRISVKDTGSGIGKEHQEIIFDEFRRLDFHKGTTEGSGLGLTITKKLVNRLGGTISLISELGKGSEFTVEIPLKKTEKKQLNDDETSSSPIYKTEQNNEDRKILFIDDDIIQLNLYSELLKDEGFQTTICPNPLDALSLIQTTPFDMIFSDIQMPGMNGFELVERIRMGAFAGAQTVPIVALSGSTKVSEQRFKEAGFSAFISKPFTSESILKVVHQFFGVKDYQCPSRIEKKEKGFAALMEFAQGDVEAGKAIVHSFINESSKNIQIIADALAGNDWDAVKKTAHRMLPLMRMISADDLVSVLVELENGSTDREKIDRLARLTKEQQQAAKEFLKTI